MHTLWASLVARALPPFTHVRLPDAYRFLPEVLPFHLAGHADNHPLNRVLAPRGTPPCDVWFEQFVQRLLAARSKTFLPVCRMSDGEFLFALGPQPPDARRPRWARWASRAVYQGHRLRHLGNFVARTQGLYHSGAYSRREWRQLRGRFGSDARALADSGILALHLTFGPVPFQEHYFPALGRWLNHHGMVLTSRNYVPFYFIYAALSRCPGNGLLHGRVLVVNSATGDKRARITAGLHRAGASEVVWCTISAQRALYDRIDVRPYIGRVDVAVVGAGIGKTNILTQMAPLAVPCIDAGFFFEIWADPRRAHERPFCWVEGDTSCAALPAL